jgi:hypothetical protein
MKVRTAKRENDYCKFFRMVREADYLTACLMHRLFVPVRQHALEAMSKAYSKKDIIPFETLKELLCFEDIEEVQEFCAYYSLPVQENGVIIHSTFVGMHE